MAKYPAIELTEEESIELKMWVNSHKTEQRYAQRAKVILCLQSHKSQEEIKKEVGLSKPAISKWKKRFLEKRIEGLRDAPRSGKPLTYTMEDHARVTELACTKPTDGYTTWSQRRIAQELGISQSKVCVILSQNKLKPHKTDYWCGKSKDPEFESKMINGSVLRIL